MKEFSNVSHSEFANHSRWCGKNPNRGYGKTICKHCGKEKHNHVLRNHEKVCYLNPLNVRNCPVCDKIIKNSSSKTCGYKCSNVLFKKTGKNHPNWKEDKNDYRSICFREHGNKCIICNEEYVVEAHHLDRNRKNNSKNNLIPLCPTHHNYLHRGYEHLIKEKIESYIGTLV